MRMFSSSQLKILAEFFSNMAIVWFAASFIGVKDGVLLFQYLTSGILALGTALYLSREVDRI